ncbi:unnamed protein product [Closterium sp. NIES-54]
MSGLVAVIPDEVCFHRAILLVVTLSLKAAPDWKDVAVWKSLDYLKVGADVVMVMIAADSGSEYESVLTFGRDDRTVVHVLLFGMNFDEEICLGDSSVGSENGSSGAPVRTKTCDNDGFPTCACEAAALGARASAAPGAGESALSGTARPVAVSLADPSGGPVLASFSTVLPCPAAPSGTLSGPYLPSFSTNLVNGADLQDQGVDQFTPARQRVTHCTCARTGRHLATFTRRPESSLYTLSTESPPVPPSGQVVLSDATIRIHEWSGRMRSTFKRYKLLKIAMGEEKMPGEGDARDRWIEKSAVLYDLILQSVNNDMFQHIKDLVELDDSGPKAWKLLRDVIQPNTLPMVIVLEKELAALSMKPGDDVKPVLDKIKDIYARMAAAGSEVSQMQQCTKIISVLDNSWDNLIPTLNVQQDKWTPEWLRQQILQEDFRRRHTGGSRRGRGRRRRRRTSRYGESSKQTSWWRAHRGRLQENVLDDGIGGAVSWRSKKQNEVGQSSCETEYMALHHGAKEVVWLRRLLEEIGVGQREPTVIFCDNESAVKLAKTACLHGLTKHIRPKWHWVRRLLDKEVRLEIVKTHQQAADILTKRLAESEHWKGMKLAGMSVAASSQVLATTSVPGPESAPYSCRLLSHQTLLWHHHLGHPSLPRLRGMASRVLVSGLPKSLPPLPSGPTPTCVPCVEGRQRAAPHSSTFPPTEAPLQTLHMDVWGPARVRGQGHERYFLLVVDDYSRYTTVFPLRRKGDVTEVLIDWIRAARLQLRESFGSDFPVLRLHSDRGGEFSSARLGAFCRARGIRQTFTLPASPQKNGIAERRIGMVMDVARTSMIHAAAPHFLWPFAVQYAAHQLNLQPRVSVPETSPTLRWTGKVGDVCVFRVWGSRAFVCDLSADKLSPRAVPCVFLGFPPDAPGWQFYHPTSRRVLSSQDVTFDESVPYYRLFPYRTAPLPPPPLFLVPGPPPVDPLPPQGPAPSGVSQVDAVEPLEVAGDSGAGSGGAEPGGAGSGGAEPGGAESGGAEPGGAEPGSAEPGGEEPGGAGSTLTPGAAGTSGAAAAAGVGPAGASGAAGAGAASGVGAGVCPAGGTAGASGGTGAAGPAGVGAAGASGAPGAGAAEGVSVGGSPDAGLSAGAGVGAVGAGGAAGTSTAAGGTGAVPAGSGDPARPRPYFVPLLEQVLGLPPSSGLAPSLECPQPVQPLSLLQPVSPLPAPSPYTGPTGGLAERREPTSRPVSPVRAARTSGRAPRQRPPADPRTHQMALHPSTASLCVPLPSPPESSLLVLADPESDSLRAASPTVARLLSTVVTDPSFESATASALVAELVDFAACCRLDYAVGLVAESVSVYPPSVGGECALSTDVLEDRQEEFQCFAAALPHLVSMRIAPEGDPDALDIPTPRSYAEAIEGPYSSQWQVKRPPGSPPVFKARYVARGFSQRQGVDYFQTFSPTPKMTTLRVLLHVAAQRDYELHSLDFSTAFLQRSLHEEIWLCRPPGFTGSFPLGTQWSLQRPVYALRQAPRQWHDTLRTTLAALGFAPSTADPSLFLRTDTSLPLFYILVYVDDLVFATADTAGLAHVKSELQKRHTCTDLGELRRFLGGDLRGDPRFSFAGSLRSTRRVFLLALHTFMLDSGASRCFFRDSTTLTPLPTPVPVRLANPSGGPVLARSSTVLPCASVLSSSLSGLHLPSFSTNLVSTAALQDEIVTTTTPGGQRVSIYTCTRTVRHLATFTSRPGSCLYTLTTEPPQVAASCQVTTSLPPLPPLPAPPCLPCVKGRQRAAPHSSSFTPMTAPLQTLHMDVWGPARVTRQSHERYFLLIVDDYTRYTTVFPLRSKGEVPDVLIPWIRAVRLQLREPFCEDLPVLHLHSDRGGEFSSDLLRDFCRAVGILQSFTLPASPQQNGVA